MEWWRDFFESEFYGGTLENFPHERTKIEVDFFLSILNLKKRAVLLDLCCGIGRHSIEIARRCYKVVGLDYNAKYLETARINAEKERLKIKFIKGDMRRIPYENYFDAVLNIFSSFGYFEKDSENFKVFTAVSRCLKPGGKFVLDMTSRDWIVRNFQEIRVSESEDTLIIEKGTFDVKENQVVSRWAWIRGGRKSEHECRIKLYPYSTHKRELEKRGLHIVGSYGGYDGSEYSLDSRRMIIVAEKRKNK
ncbi:MAG: class I SAM-dependent methyltransferase [bacterium]